jgi:glycosyltransferase involved in cell wall biosynthesis
MKVLLDLSLCIYPHNGMNQDMRMLLKGLAQDPEIEVTGLIYSRRQGSFHHRLCPDGNKADRLHHQAGLLRSMVSEDPSVFGKPGLARTWRDWRRRVVQRRFRVQPLADEALFPLVWRHYLQHSFEAEDAGLLGSLRYVVSDLVADSCIERALEGRPEPVLETEGYDVAVFPDVTPLRVAAGTRKIVRYHDMIPLLLPDTLQHHRHISYHFQSILSCRKDSYFVCDSDATRGDLCSVFEGMEGRSRTIPCAVSGHFHPDRGGSGVEAVLRRRAVEGRLDGGGEAAKPYFLAVSTVEPRKNYAALLEAFEAVSERTGAGLVLVGAEGWGQPAVLAQVRRLAAGGRLIWLRGVTPHEMRLLYSGAAALISVSLAEGFGYSGAEAMKCGTPVVASDIPVHREVCGPAAVYCDPLDTGSIREALAGVLEAERQDAPQRRERIRAGLERAAAFEAAALLPRWKELFTKPPGVFGGSGA